MLITPSTLTPQDTKQRLAIDSRALDDLKLQAQKDPKAAIKKVASEFEAMFLNILMQSMRETSFSGEEESSALNTFRGMQDQQTVQQMSHAGGMGLGDMIARQIAKQSGIEWDEPVKKTAAASSMQLLALQKPAIAKALQQLEQDGVQSTTAKPAAGRTNNTQNTNSGDFIQSMLNHAAPAARAIGVEPQLIVAHAALESGWGKRNIKNADGSNSHNLFGIKATGNWKGATTDVLTTEYVDGVAQKRVERFRSYPSYSHAFADYARLLSTNSRYQDALNKGADAVGFARALAKGGYATDPNYAAKLSQVAGSEKMQVAARS